MMIAIYNDDLQKFIYGINYNINAFSRNFLFEFVRIVKQN